MYEQKVKINNEHRYFDDVNKEYIGFSKLYDKFMCEPFNTMASYGVAKSEGISSDEVLKRWDRQREEGVRIDNCLDLYAFNGNYRLEDLDIIDGVKEILKVYENYKVCKGQGIVFSEKYRVAGTYDKISFLTNRKDTCFIMSDFKCFEKEISFMPKGNKFLKEPFNHLSNTKYTKIAFQLSFYSYLFESLTGNRPIRQFIHWIDPKSMIKDENDNLDVKHKLIDVPYLKNDIIIFLETYKDKIIDILEPKTMEAF